MAPDREGDPPHETRDLSEEAFAKYMIPMALADLEPEDSDSDMELVRSPAEPSIDGDALPTTEDVNAIQKAAPRSQPLPFVIPEGAEVIDLDMVDDDSFTFVYDVDEGVMVKEEPVDTLMTEIDKHADLVPLDEQQLVEPVMTGTEKHAQSLSRHDERRDKSRATEPLRTVSPNKAPNPLNPTVESTGDVDDQDINEEDESNCSSLQCVRSLGVPNEHIEISDDEVPVRLNVDAAEGSPEVEQLIKNNPILPPKKLLVTKKKPRSQLTDAEKAKVAEIQAKLAARVTGKPVAVVPGSVSKAPGIDVRPAGPADPAQQPDDPYAWMHDDVEVEDDDEALQKFEALKKKFHSKKRSRKATFEDEINFQRAEKAERARLKRQEELEPAIADNGEEDNGLFVPLADPSQTPHKHQCDNVDGDSDEDGEPTTKRSKLGPNEKKLHATILKEGMLAAVEAEMAKKKNEDKKGKGKKDFSRKKAGDKKKYTKRKPKPGSKATETSADKPKATKPSQKSRAKGTKSSKGKKKQPTLLNLNSLLHSNVYADANASLDSGPITLMTETRKADALKQLIASVPLDDQRIANREKEHVLKATIALGKRKVKPDGNGGWAFKGMISSLKNHQVQGAAWMKERETGTDEPFGGLVGDEMGFGKTVQMLACMVANPAPLGELSRATLIVATPAICGQWAAEIEKHCNAEVLGDVVRYHASSRLTGAGAVKMLQKAGVILTTYGEVLRSYPKYAPPKEIITHEKRMDWWKEHYAENRGVLHRISFFRVVLDEAQAIKNHLSKTSIACRGLTTKCRWAMSGTPIQNSVEEVNEVHERIS